MTVPAAVTTYRYEGNGVTTVFAYSNRLFTTADVKVDILTRATDAVVETLALTTDYTVTIVSNSLANITITNAAKIPSVTQDILLTLNLSADQTRSFPRADSLPAADIEKGLDKLTLLNQVLRDDVTRSLRFPDSDTMTDGELPPKAERLGKFLAFGSTDGEPIVTEVAVGSTPVTAFGATLIQSVDAADARTNLGVLLPPFVDSTAIMKGSADATKLLRIEVDGLTTATTRVWTAPDSDLTVVGTSTTQTLSNKIVNTVASTTAAAALNIPHGTAPTSPVNGDSWTTTSGDFARINGVTRRRDTFGLEFVSSDQTITSAGALTLAHSLGVTPSLVQCYLICQTGELGYTAGDIVLINFGFNDQSASIRINATNVLVRFGSSAGAFAITRADTGAGATITNGNWRLRVKAWA